MAYQVLYRKYRPQTFDEVVGQDHIVKTLLNAVHKNKISHAYLFCGPRGTGKTSIAKIFAKALNCTSEDKIPCGECENCKAIADGSFPDLFELDAASNNSVDNIRDLIEGASYQPLQGRYKIYILDEVHMLSASAANALLKTLEEPPAHVIFILATTDPQKLLPTILSRCQRYNFTKVSDEDMKRRIKEILEKEKIEYEEKALDIICDLADGCVRDALSYLDEALAYGDYKLMTADLIQMFGLLTKDAKVELLIDMRSRRIDDAITKTKALYREGVDIKALTQDLIKIFKDLVIYNETQSERLLVTIAKEDADKLATVYTNEEALTAIDILIRALEVYRKGQDQLSYFEIAILKIADLKTDKKERPKTSSIFDEEIKLVEKKPDVKLELDEIKMKKDDIIAVLKTASREQKSQDVIIYERLRDFSFDENKRRYFALLKDTEIFASSKDMIVFGAYTESGAHQINDIDNNKDLYYFLIDEFGIDKMVYALGPSEKETVIRSFRASADEEFIPYEVVRYPKRENKDLVSKLEETFGKVEVIDE